MQNESRGQWLTTGAAAAALGVAPKTVRRRIERGELEARKAAREGGGVGWLVLIGGEVDSETPIEADTKRTRNAHRNGQPRRQSERVMDSETPIETDKGAERKGHETPIEKDSVNEAERVSDLRDEVKFLRGVIEQLQRDGAETRAALREALKSKTPQLTAGDAAPIATEATGRDEKRETAKDSPKDASGSRRSTSARESGFIDYNAIADEIERSRGQK